MPVRGQGLADTRCQENEFTSTLKSALYAKADQVSMQPLCVQGRLALRSQNISSRASIEAPIHNTFSMKNTTSAASSVEADVLFWCMWFASIAFCLKVMAERLG